MAITLNAFLYGLEKKTPSIEESFETTNSLITSSNNSYGVLGLPRLAGFDPYNFGHSTDSPFGCF